MTTSDPDIARKVRMMANHGQPQKHTHLIEGRNSRMDGIHAAVLSVKLRHLDKWTEERIQAAASYQELLKGAALTLPHTPDGFKHVFHLYVVQSEDREGLTKKLGDAGISTAIHYPTPMPAMACYAPLLTPQADYAKATAFCGRILSLPMFAEIQSKEQMSLSRLIL
jgi:dTDP-4-amino-4,6-dideoxygalactose transaminase